MSTVSKRYLKLVSSISPVPHFSRSAERPCDGFQRIRTVFALEGV